MAAFGWIQKIAKLTRCKRWYWVMIVCYISLVTFADETSKVSVSLESDEIVFGKEAQLKCKVTGKFCGEIIRWTKGKSKEIIANNGLLRENGTRYEIMQISACKSVIKIHDIGVADVNDTYICSYGFKEAKYKFVKEIFRQFPKNQTMQCKQLVMNKTLICKAHLEAVYPIPECVFIFEEQKISVNISAKMATMKPFYDVDFHARFHMINATCNSTVTMSCSFGTTNKKMYKNDINTCHVVTGHFEGQAVSPVSTIIIVVVVVCLITQVLFLAAFVYGRRRKNSRNTDVNNQIPKEDAEDHLLTEAT